MSRRAREIFDSQENLWRASLVAHLIDEGMERAQRLAQGVERRRRAVKVPRSEFLDWISDSLKPLIQAGKDFELNMQLKTLEDAVTAAAQVVRAYRRVLHWYGRVTAAVGEDGNEIISSDYADRVLMQFEDVPFMLWEAVANLSKQPSNKKLRLKIDLLARDWTILT